MTSRSPAARAVSAASKHQSCPELGPLGHMRKNPACPQLFLTRHVEESLHFSSWLCSRRNNIIVRRMFLRPVDSMCIRKWDGVMMLLCTQLWSLEPFSLRSSCHEEGTEANISHNLKPHSMFFKIQNASWISADIQRRWIWVGLLRAFLHLAWILRVASRTDSGVVCGRAHNHRFSFTQRNQVAQFHMYFCTRGFAEMH